MRHTITPEERARSGRKKIGSARTLVLPDDVWEKLDTNGKEIGSNAQEIIRNLMCNKKTIFKIEEHANLIKTIRKISAAIKSNGENF